MKKNFHQTSREQFESGDFDWQTVFVCFKQEKRWELEAKLQELQLQVQKGQAGKKVFQVSFAVAAGRGILTP